MIHSLRDCLDPILRTSVLGLLLLAVIFLGACTDATSTPTSAPTSAPTSETTQPAAASVRASTPTATTTLDATPDSQTASPSAPPLQVVATSNIVADWAQVVGGDRVDVFSLLTPGSDPHTFVPGAREVAKIADADMVLSIGLGLEAGWLSELLHNASADDSPIIALGDAVDPLEFSEDDDHDDHMDEGDDHMDEGDDGHDDDGHDDDGDDHMDDGDDHDEDGHDEDEHDHGLLDPHFWFDPNRVKIAAYEIAARFSIMDPRNAGLYFQNAADYEVQLNDLHSWTQEQVQVVPPERRLLVTNHDTFAYFADVYEFEVIGLLIPAFSPEAEPSAEHIAGVVDVVREHNAPAVFSETTVSEKLPQAVANETGAVLVQLYADSLGAIGTPGETYLGMVRTNVERIVEALR